MRIDPADWRSVPKGMRDRVRGPTVTLQARGSLSFNRDALELLFDVDQIEERMEVELVWNSDATALGIRPPTDGAPLRVMRQTSNNRWSVFAQSGLLSLGLPKKFDSARRITPRLIGDVLAVPLKELSS